MPGRTYSSLPARAMGLALAAGLLSVAVSTGCEQRSDAAVAIESARLALSEAQAGGGSDAYRTVITSLQPHLSTDDPAEKASASLLTARSQIGVVEPEITAVIEAEAEAIRLVRTARAHLTLFTELSASAQANEAVNVTDDLSAMRNDLSERQRELETARQTAARLEAELADLEAQVEAKLAQSRSLRNREGELTLQVSRVSATEGAELAEQARVVGRQADAIELESAEIEADAESVRPQLLEANLDIQRLTGQIQTINDAETEALAVADQARDDAAEASSAARDAASAFGDAVDAIISYRSDNVTQPLSTARTSLERAARSARSARSEFRKKSSVVVGHANQALATLLAANASGLSSVHGLLEQAVNAPIALPDSSRFAQQQTTIAEELAAIEEALAEARAASGEAMVSAGAREPEPEPEFEDELSDDGFDASEETD